MRGRWERGLVVGVVATVALLGCSGDDTDSSDDTVVGDQAEVDDGGADPDQAAPDADDAPDDAPDDAAAPDPGTDTDGGTEAGSALDPDADVEDGVYRGNGVVLPVPDGWSMDADAMTHGVAVATSPDETAQMSAVAVDADELGATGQTTDLDLLLDRVRSQLGRDADVDEEVSLAGADRAHRLTFLDFPPPAEGPPDSSATMMIAESGDGLLGEFTYSAASATYDLDHEAVFVEVAGFDAGSRPG